MCWVISFVLILKKFQSIKSVLDHLGHLLLLRRHIRLFLLLFILLPRIWSHFSHFIHFISALLAELLFQVLLLLLIDLLRLCIWSLFPVLLALIFGWVRQSQAHNFVNQLHNDLENFQSLGHRILSRTDLNAGSHEDWVLVVDLLIGDMQLVEATSVLLKHVSDGRVDKLVCNLFVFAEDDKVVFLG